MRTALAALLLLSALGARAAEHRRDLSDPDAFKQFVEGSRLRQGMPEELPAAKAQAPAPKPLPAFTGVDKKPALDSSRVPRWTPELGTQAQSKGFPIGSAAALGGLGAVAFLAGMSLRRSNALDGLELKPEPAAASEAPAQEPLPRVDLEPLPPDAKA